MSTVTAIAACVIAVAGALEILRRMALAWAERHVIAPLNETRHQVTANHHSSMEPTVLDRISDVVDQVADLRASVERQQTTMTAVTLVLDEHLRWSREWVQDHE